jgi:hypothetical protein
VDDGSNRRVPPELTAATGGTRYSSCPESICLLDPGLTADRHRQSGAKVGLRREGFLNLPAALSYRLEAVKLPPLSAMVKRPFMLVPASSTRPVYVIVS